MNLTELVHGLDVEVLRAGSPEILDVVVDSRAVSPGALFVARKGWYVDGHQYLAKAVELGAAAVVVSDRTCDWSALNVPVVFCADEDPLLGQLAARFFGHPTRELKVFGVTGTNGKTSVAWMLDELLRASGETTALISTIAYRIGDSWRPAPNTTPDALVLQRFAREAVQAGATALVMEVSSHGAAIGRIAETAFDAIGFTNITRDHLDFHGDDEGYARAKAAAFSLYGRLSVLEGGKNTQAVFMAGNDAFQARALGPVDLDERLEHLRPLSARLDGAPMVHLPDWSVELGKKERPLQAREVRVELVESLGVQGSRIRVSHGVEVFESVVRAAGDFQVENAALAATMVHAVLGSRSKLRSHFEVLERFAGVPGRMELVADPVGDEPAVFVDYAHTPDALRTILASARGLQRPPLVAVAGCGGNRDRGKRPLMAKAVEEGADHVVLTSDNPRNEEPLEILEEMAAGLSSRDAASAIVVERRDAIDFAVSNFGGTIVVAGKGHETYEEIRGQRFHWDDRDEARAALAKRRFGLLAPTRLGGWSMRHLAFATRGEIVGTGLPLFRGLSTDTRTIQPGDIFVALRGENHDGHTHVNRAFELGASAAVVEIEGDWAGPVVKVRSTSDALQAIARTLLGEAKRTQQGFEIIAITGSNGKTTTRALTCGWVNSRSDVSALSTKGNFNNQIGLPLSVAPLELRQTKAVLEMGANRFGDIAELVAIARPSVAVLTSIGASHLQGFGSLDGVREAKAEMVRNGRPKLVVMPYSESLGIWGQAAAEVGAKVLTFGSFDEPASLQCRRLRSDGPIELRGNAVWSGFSLEIPLPIPGRHNAGNLAASLLASSWEGGGLRSAPTKEEGELFLRALSPPPGRMERYSVGDHTVIFDAYNANPSSTLAALDVLRDGMGQRVAVLGELFELGDNELELHAQVLDAASEHSDLVVAVGPRWGTGDERNIRRFLDRDAATEFIIAQTSTPSTLLWKGSRGARLETLRDVVEARWRQGAN